MSSTLVLAAIGLGALYLATMGKKEKGSSYLHPTPNPMEKEGITIPSDAPPVPVYSPETSVSIPFQADAFTSGPKMWRTAFDKNKELAAIAADQTFLFRPEASEAYQKFMAYVDEKMVTNFFSNYAYNRRMGYATPGMTISLKFDQGLPAPYRALAFLGILAKDWDDLLDFLSSEFMAQYPLFRNSVFEKSRDVLGAPYASEAPWKKKSSGGMSGVDPDVSEKERPFNAKGPTVIQGITIPKGGRIEEGIPYHVIQAGEWGAQKIAEAWKKKNPASWVQAIVKENPGKKWGAGGNVHVGTDIKLPLGFLDPNAESPTSAGSGSGGGGAPTSPKSIPGSPDVYPSVAAPPGHLWVYNLVTSRWEAVPVGNWTPGDEDDDDGNPPVPDFVPPVVEETLPNIPIPKNPWILGDTTMACCSSCEKGKACEGDNISTLAGILYSFSQDEAPTLRYMKQPATGRVRVIGYLEPGSRYF